MNLPSDPVIKIQSIADAIGVSPTAIRAAIRDGHAPHRRRGYAALLGTMKGLLDHARAEASIRTPYARPASAPKLPGPGLADLRAVGAILSILEGEAAHALNGTAHGRRPKQSPRFAAEVSALLGRAQVARQDTLDALQGGDHA